MVYILKEDAGIDEEIKEGRLEGGRVEAATGEGDGAELATWRARSSRSLVSEIIRC